MTAHSTDPTRTADELLVQAAPPGTKPDPATAGRQA
jgi:hypothetical protein